MSEATVRLERILAYDGIELAKTRHGGSLTLLELGDQKTSTATRVLCDTTVEGTRIRLELEKEG